MGWWETRRRHLRSTPSEDGLRALTRAVSRGSTVVGLRRLAGGLGAATHAVTIRSRSGRTHDVVLKRFDEASPQHAIEWGRTVFAAGLPVPSPEPIAFDEDGSWFGAPALVLGRIPGRAYLTFENDDRAFEQIAEASVTLASTPKRGLPATVRRAPTGTDWRPPTDLRRTPMVERALRAMDRLRPAAMRQETVIAHGDFHPGNTLWSRGSLTGLVDWGYCNLAYRARDIGYCRVEIAVLFGARAADRFVGTYERIAGRPAEHLKYWSLAQGVSALGWVRWWAYAYRQQGRRDLTDEIAIRRARAFVKRELG